VGVTGWPSAPRSGVGSAGAGEAAVAASLLSARPGPAAGWVAASSGEGSVLDAGFGSEAAVEGSAAGASAGEGVAAGSVGVVPAVGVLGSAGVSAPVGLPAGSLAGALARVGSPAGSSAGALARVGSPAGSSAGVSAPVGSPVGPSAGALAWVGSPAGSSAGVAPWLLAFTESWGAPGDGVSAGDGVPGAVVGSSVAFRRRRRQKPRGLDGDWAMRFASSWAC
jgi:hypothetical protein